MKEILKVENLCKSYNKEEILKDISFSLNEGETLCIIGSSGSGKSTLLRCINNLESIDKGNITIDNNYLINKEKRLNKRRMKNVNMNTTIVFQDFNLFPHMSVKENITFAQVKSLKRDKKEADEITIKILK